MGRTDQTRSTQEPAPTRGRAPVPSSGFSSTEGSERTVTTYILRRLLYSIPVLFAASFLVFAMVSATGDPLGTLRMTPNISQQTLDQITEKQASRRADPRPLLLLARGGRDREVRLDHHRRAADLGRPRPRAHEHPAARDRRRADRDHPRGLHRRVLRRAPVLPLRLRRNHLQLPRALDAGLLARAHAAGARREHLPHLRHTHLLRLQPELARPGQLPARPRPAPGAAGDRARGREHRAVQPLHARLDARGDQLRLRAHGAGEGAAGAHRDHEARVPERARSRSRR